MILFGSAVQVKGFGSLFVSATKRLMVADLDLDFGGGVTRDLGRDLFLFGAKETILAAHTVDESVLLNMGTSSLPHPFAFAALRRANLKGSAVAVHQLRS